MSIELISAMGASLVATAGAAALSKLLRPVIIEQRKDREKRRDVLKGQIKKKIEGGIVLEANEISDIGRGLRMSPGSAVESLYELYAESGTTEEHTKYKKLIDDLNRTEPFETLPEESRPSLARLAELCAGSSQLSDRELLQPITKQLGEFQDMKRDHATIKRQNKISYVIALVSFFIGILGIILSFTGPSKSFIEASLVKNKAEILSAIQESKEKGHADAQDSETKK